jgi:hypothetical protein
MKRIFFFALLLVGQQLSAQNSADVRRAWMDFIVDGDTLRNSLTGGMSSPILSHADLNHDGIQDLVAYEHRTGIWGIPLTFINHGAPGQPDYCYAPEFEANFPTYWNYLLMRDYNTDGISDIFCFSPPTVGVASGIMVLRGYYDADDRLAFERVVDDLSYPLQIFGGGTISAQIYVLNGDIPAIDDLDGDGDLDILNFNNLGGWMEMFRNISVESGYGTDSLLYVFEDNCWGRFYEPTPTNTLALSGRIDSCSFYAGWEPRNGGVHAGSAIATIDMDDDGDMEVVLGDIQFDNLVMGYNQGTTDTAFVNSQDDNFPSNTLPVDLFTFPAAYFFDGNNDGKTDLFATPTAIDRSENKNCIWWYENTGTEELPVFTYRQDDFLMESMVDHGADAHPVFFDHNGDGLLDLVLGHYGYVRPAAVTEARLLLFENVGTSTNPVFELINSDLGGLSPFGTNTNYYAYAPTFGDLDGDGDQDMVVGKEDGILLFFENQAAAGAPATFSSFLPFFGKIDVGSKATPTLFDFDNDGLLDLLIGEKYGNINFFKNTGSPTQPIFDSNVDPGSGFAIPTVQFLGLVDTRRPLLNPDGWSVPKVIDHNGVRSLFVGTYFGEVRRYTDLYAAGGGIAPTFVLADTAFGNIFEGFHSSPAIADLNSDGKLDYLVGNQRGGLRLYSEGAMGSAPCDVPLTGFSPVVQYPAALTVFPNPASGTVFLELPSEGDLFDVTLFNTMGQAVKRQQLKGVAQLSLDGLPMGIYAIVAIRQGERLSSKILVR